MPTDEKENGDRKPNENKEQVLSVKDSNKTKNADEIKQRTEYEKKEPYWFWQRKTWIILQCLFNVALIGIYGFQIYYMRQQWTAMTEQLNFIRSQVDITSKQTEIMNEHMIISQRAWVMVKGVTHSGLKVGEPISAELLITNAGNTPALNVTFDSVLELRKIPVPSPMPFIPVQGRSISVIAPHTDVFQDISFNQVLTPERVNAIVQFKFGLYAYGIIKYDDIFGKRRHTYFCFAHDENTPFAFNTCSNNNTAD